MMHVCLYIVLVHIAVLPFVCLTHLYNNNQQYNTPIQRKLRQSKGDFEAFCRKIGWTTTDGEVERKKRWFGASEFIYDVKKAPEGHLPLTSALRGTSLIKELLAHPVWDNDDWKKEPQILSKNEWMYTFHEASRRGEFGGPQLLAGEWGTIKGNELKQSTTVGVKR